MEDLQVSRESWHCPANPFAEAGSFTSSPSKFNLAMILIQPKNPHQTCNGLARKYFNIFSQIGMPSRSPAVDNDGFREH